MYYKQPTMYISMTREVHVSAVEIKGTSNTLELKSHMHPLNDGES